MGRHSIGDERVFWRSFGFFLVKWVGVAALPLLAIWGIWRLVGQPDQEVSTATVRASESPSVISEAIPPPSPEPSPEPTAEPSPSPTPRVERGKIQVLNGSSTQGLGFEAANKLRAAGYDVVAVQNASRHYEKTTVFYQPGFEDMAKDAAAIIGATVVEAAPSNVSKAIPLTAVVGADFKS